MKKTRSPILFGTAFLVALTLFATLAPQNAAAEEAIYDLKLQSVWKTPSTNKAVEEFAENVKKATNGKVKITVYSSDELVKTKGVFSALQSGAVDMACSAGAYNRSVPEAVVEFGLPFSWNSFDEMMEAWNDYGVSDIVKEAYAEQGVHLLTIQPASKYVLMSKKPVNNVEDFKGMKIRAVGLVANIVQSLGAAPSNIPGAEQYVALQRGTVDATVFPSFVLDAYKLREVVEYVVLPTFIAPPTTNLMINLELWNSFPAEIREQITSASTEHIAAMDKTYDEADAKALKNFVDEHNGKVITLPEAEVAKMRTVAYTEWDKLGTKSPRLGKLVDIMKKFAKDKGRM